MRTFHKPQHEPDALILGAATWLAAGIVLFGLTPLPLHDARYGWSLAFWLIAAPLAMLAVLAVLRHAHHSPAPARLRSIRRRNSRITRR